MIMANPSPLAIMSPGVSSPRNARLFPAEVKGVILLVVAIAIWGGNWPVMKAGLSHIGPIWFSASRFILGAICLFGLQIFTRTIKCPTKRDVPLILSVGLLQMLAFTLLSLFAMMDIPAGRSAVLSYTTPLWVTPAVLLFFKERLTKTQIAGSLLGVIGVAVLFNPMALDWNDWTLLRANLMLLGAAFCWALCILHLRYYKPDSSVFQLAPWQMLFAAIPLIVVAFLIEGGFSGDGSFALWQVLLYVGVLATAFCFCAVNTASTWLSSTSMATAMLGVPVVGLLTSVLFLGEQMTISLTIGVLAIAIGIAAVSLKRK